MLFDKIQFYFELAAGSNSLDLQEEELKNIGNRSIASVIKDLNAKNIRPEEILPENSYGLIRCDIKLIEFSIKALLENAVKHSPQDSTISIKMTESENEFPLSV